MFHLLTEKRTYHKLINNSNVNFVPAIIYSFKPEIKIKNDFSQVFSLN